MRRTSRLPHQEVSHASKFVLDTLEGLGDRSLSDLRLFSSAFLGVAIQLLEKLCLPLHCAAHAAEALLDGTLPEIAALDGVGGLLNDAIKGLPALVVEYAFEHRGFAAEAFEVFTLELQILYWHIAVDGRTSRFAGIELCVQLRRLCTQLGEPFGNCGWALDRIDPIRSLEVDIDLDPIL